LHGNCLLQVIEGKKGEGIGVTGRWEEEVGPHWIIFKKREGIVNWKRKLKLALRGKLLKRI
jgi:hypothetical protein